MNDLMHFLSKTLGITLSVNHELFVRRKVEERMAELGFTNSGHYLEYLKTNPAGVAMLNEILTVVVSQFFRNPMVFEYLLDRIIPEMVQNNRLQADSAVRVWSAGCAAGEEAYSMAMLWLEARKHQIDRLNINIIATDIDDAALKKGAEGVFTAESLGNVRLSFLNQYFTRENDRYVVAPEVKKLVHFSKYDLFDKYTYAPPESMFGDFDLVLCRNVLIYYNGQHQVSLLSKLQRATVENGYLVLGEAESLPPSRAGNFKSEPGGLHIYRKMKK